MRVGTLEDISELSSASAGILTGIEYHTSNCEISKAAAAIIFIVMSAAAPGMWEDSSWLHTAFTCRICFAGMFWDSPGENSLAPAACPLFKHEVQLSSWNQNYIMERDRVCLSKCQKLWNYETPQALWRAMSGYKIILTNWKTASVNGMWVYKHKSRHRHCTKPREKMTDRQKSLQWMFCTWRDWKDKMNQ